MHFNRFSTPYQTCLGEVGRVATSCNQHEWVWGECEYEPMSGPSTDNSNQEITYFRCGEPAFVLLQRIVTDRTLLVSLKSYPKFRYGTSWSVDLTSCVVYS